MGEFIMNYVISTDACADMPVGYEKEHDIPIVPMPYSLKMPKGTLKNSTLSGRRTRSSILWNAAPTRRALFRT